MSKWLAGVLGIVVAAALMYVAGRYVVGPYNRMSIYDTVRSVPEPPKPPELTREERIARLRRVAKEKGLRFYVRCLSWTPEEEYLGVAWHKETGSGDTTKDRWLISAPTQMGAVEQLTSTLDGPPTNPGEPYKPIVEEQHHRICPPDIKSLD